jgi:hypothetical protein
MALQLLHLPDKPTGVEWGVADDELADELLHLPGKPAGVVRGGTMSIF